MHEFIQLTSPVVIVILSAVVTQPGFAQEISTEYAIDDAGVVETLGPVQGPVHLPPVHLPPVAGCDRCGDSSCDGQYCSPGCCSSGESFKCRQQAKWWGFPGEFHELPLGAASNSIFEAQAMRGQAARLTLYDYDFVPGASTLKARGQRRLKMLANVAQNCGGTIVIQSMGSDLDARRHVHVQTLASNTLGLHPDQIVIGDPIAGGLRGEEATIIHQNHLKNVQEYGVRRFDFGSFSTQRDR